MQNLITRSISGLVYVLLFISAILYSKESYFILIAIFSAICLWEFQRIIQSKSFLPYIFLPLAIYLFQNYNNSKLNLTLLLLVLFSSLQQLITLYLPTKKTKRSFWGKLDLSIRYIILPFSFLMILPIINNDYKPNVVIGIIVLIWTNDSFAYLIGKNFGKTKLFETISPKKTIEGFIGGLVFSVISGIIISYSIKSLQIWNWVIISIIVSVFGTFGDLIESKFKRQANVKDSGTIMPGHGGLLDRLDSLYYLAPFVYLYIHYLM